MRLGGPVQAADPDQWIKQLIEHDYTCAALPKNVGIAQKELQDTYQQAAKSTGIVIAEVGAWSNPLSMDEEVREQAIQYCQEQLQVAERIGACCCVNIAGSKSTKWDGPHPDNITEDTFALIVDTIRTIIDAVKPKHTFYTLEPMPWMYPYDVDSYLRLIAAIDRPQFAVHLDPMNMISSVERYYANAEFLRDCFKRLGPYIKSCHAKDIVLRDHLTVHLEETWPGNGRLDYKVFLNEVNKLSSDMPVLLEHLQKDDEYKQGAEYIRQLARQENITIKSVHSK
ncbi:hypothetical protein GCM10011391_07660 [Pullulanibacillus camelliae]|uniref:Xylose isomerase-like TIM barrel domain-containing protein n=1 Tax=Pullulanibacillus camelliae TaxID=1707096 RepID=A0A8J2YFT7_9BACL|nr:sugar phosphate isomerase/epimerase family protein [Pullulanibacillus camelliae]GGE31474.1 hypothetical protein GCM10011391_07660 [Pullulanibacillus camelliae]